MAKRSPILGYNHNVRYRGLVFHVQTEDSGVLSPHLFTHLFYGGTIISTRKLVYDAGSAEDAIKALMQAQHKAVMKDLKNGSFDEKIDQYLAGTEGLEPRSSTARMRDSKPVVTPPDDADKTERATTDVDSTTIEAVHARVSRVADDDLTTPIELSLEPTVGHAPTVQVHAPTVEVHAPTIDVQAPDTEPVAKPHGALEIDSTSNGPVSYCCAPQGRDDCGDHEPAISMLADRETGSVHGDTLAIDEIIVTASNPEFAARVGNSDPIDSADLVDQSREHSNSVDGIDGHQIVAKSLTTEYGDPADIRRPARRRRPEGRQRATAQYDWCLKDNQPVYQFSVEERRGN